MQNNAIHNIDISNVTANYNYKSVELFANAGCLALGLEKAGFNTVGLVELDKYAAETLIIMGKSYFSGGGGTGMARKISWDEPSLTLCGLN